MKLLMDPTVITSLLIALFAIQLSKLGTLFLAKIAALSSVLMQKTKLISWKHNKKILIRSKNHGELIRAVVRTYFLLAMFCMLGISYGVLITVGPLRQLGQFPTEVQLFLTAPLYCFEILWLMQREYTNELIDVSSRANVRSYKHRREKP